MSFSNITGGASTGATLGGAVGSIIPGVGTAIGAGVGGLLGGAAGGLFGRSKSKETSTQKKQRELVDQLLGSLNGQGPYSDLFNANEADFQRSFAEPARARFRNQTAPQIQQSYIAEGQQRSTGLEDKLARAGVDMDQLLNEQYMDYQQGAQNRKANAISGILGQGEGAAPEQGYGEAIGQGVSGYLGSPKFGKNLEDILAAYSKKNAPQTDPYEQTPKGFENDNAVYNPYIGAQP